MGYKYYISAHAQQTYSMDRQRPKFFKIVENFFAIIHVNKCGDHFRRQKAAGGIYSLAALHFTYDAWRPGSVQIFDVLQVNEWN